jgi:hypothetical protein
MAIGGSITSATEGSVLFAGTAGILQQDNANFFWDDTNNRLLIGTNTQIAANRPLQVSSAIASAVVAIRNSNAAGFPVINFFDETDVSRVGIGYNNVSNLAVIDCVDNGPLAFQGGGTTRAILDLASDEVSFQLANGGTAAVSDASTGRIRYTTTGQKFQVSMNGGAYVDLATGSGTIGVERLSADGAASPTLDVTYVSGTGTDLTLANGAVDGFQKVFIVTGGSGTITPANLADGDVLTWTAAPANVSFRWDATAVTWHVDGSPYNMVTT